MHILNNDQIINEKRVWCTRTCQPNIKDIQKTIKMIHRH